MICYLTKWLKDSEYEEFIYDRYGTRIVYRNHRDFYDSFKTRKETIQAEIITENSWFQPGDPHIETFAPTSLEDKALKQLVITDYIRLNQIYRRESPAFCCIQRGVHIDIPERMKGNEPLIRKYEYELLRLNSFCTSDCRQCWHNATHRNNKAEHQKMYAEVQRFYTINLQMVEEARRIRSGIQETGPPIKRNKEAF
jgi:hypothetical protein